MTVGELVKLLGKYSENTPVCLRVGQNLACLAVEPTEVSLHKNGRYLPDDGLFAIGDFVLIEAPL